LTRLFWIVMRKIQPSLKVLLTLMRIENTFC
jgi:hypothetical protein